MKRFRIYYYYVAIPVLLVLLGSVVFFDEIRSTIDGNPHPQINYFIFLLMGVTVVQVWLHLRRISKESIVLDAFVRNASRGNYDEAERRLNADRDRFKQFDVIHPLRVVLRIRGGIVDSTLHGALLEEVDRFHRRLHRRLVLTQYMSGMMVGMGLLGTFVGLLAALAEIGVLIGSFDMSAAASDPAGMIAGLVSRLVAPMKSLGIAFSASLFGVFGSLLAGLLMVSVKAATNELSAVLESRLNSLVNLGIEEDREASASQLTHALSELAQHSPVLQGLIVALDKSERRTREAMTAVTLIAARLDSNTQSNERVLQAIDRSLQSQNELHSMLGQMKIDFPRIVQSQQRMEDLAGTFTQASAEQIETLQGMVRVQDSAYRRALEEFLDVSQHQKALLDGQSDAAKRQELQIQALWQQQLSQYEELFARSLKFFHDQAAADRNLLQAENRVVQETLTANQKTMQDVTVRLMGMLEQQRDMSRKLVSSQEEGRLQLNTLASQMAAAAEAMRADGVTRSEQIYNLYLQLVETMSRLELILFVRQDASKITTS